MEMTKIPPFKIKSVEPIKITTKKEREAILKAAFYNVFKIKSEDVIIDMLTDSGTGAMSANQWSALMNGDEAYAGSRSFFNVQKAVKDIMGFDHVIPTHQGRGAEHIVDRALLNQNSVVPGNYHFDTTRAHIENMGAIGIDCVVDEIFNPELEAPFKGNMDLQKLETVLLKNRGNVPYVLMTITCNSGGGQPVSLKNIQDTAALCKKYGTLFFIDGARYAENACFIKMREPGQGNRSIREIIKDIFADADGLVMSSKKDAIVNIGGMVALKSKALYDKIVPFCIMYEGLNTYGGLAGRDLEALAVGLYEGTDENYLMYRLEQTAFLANELIKRNIPIIRPAGGHAVYIDAGKLMSHMPRNQYPGQVLCSELYLEGGVRGVEVGTLMAGRDPQSGEERIPKLELVRLAIPRRVYMMEHMLFVADAVERVANKKMELKGLKITDEPQFLRHFLAKFDKVQ